MHEQHNIECKQSWHSLSRHVGDDYLKTICAFANSQGGSCFVCKKIVTYSNNNLIFNHSKPSGKLVTDHLDYAEWIITSTTPKIQTTFYVICFQFEDSIGMPYYLNYS